MPVPYEEVYKSPPHWTGTGGRPDRTKPWVTVTGGRPGPFGRRRCMPVAYDSDWEPPLVRRCMKQRGR